MKRVAEAAEELDVSRSTVYNYLKKLEEELEPHLDEEEGATVISDEGVDMISREMDKVHGQTEISSQREGQPATEAEEAAEDTAAKDGSGEVKEEEIVSSEGKSDEEEIKEDDETDGTVTGVRAEGALRQRVNSLEDKVEELQKQLRQRDEQLKEQMEDIVNVTNTLYEFTDHLDQQLSEMKDMQSQTILEKIRGIFSGADDYS